VRPVIGTGVGLARFVWPTGDGNVSVALYVHNEYAQVWVDLGAVGLVLLAILAAAIVVVIRRGRRYPHRPGLRAGAIGGLAAFAVHSGFDFLWHIPVLPLVAALLVGLAGPGATEEPIHGKETEQEEQ
jgi:O-antigen ligase